MSAIVDALQAALLEHPSVDVLTDVIAELLEAESKYPPMHSAHEGFAILKEEVDELWGEVKRRPDAIRREAMRNEAVQVVAMALRFIIDVCDKETAR